MTDLAVASPDAPPVDIRRELLSIIPHLRAFARGLCGKPDVADDLVQETLLKAWAARDSFQPGTSMRAWTFVILRNAFLSSRRRDRFHGDYDEVAAEHILVEPAAQEGPIHLADLSRALLMLPPERREALLLVGAGGFSYEEAAGICGCAVGTIKSRVGRARAALTAMIEEGRIAPAGSADPVALAAINDALGAGRGQRPGQPPAR